MSWKGASTAVVFALLALPAASLAQGQFLRSADDLADPRGYCLDIPGFGPRMQIDAPIYTHSCKYSLPGFDADEIFSYADGKLSFVNYGRCLAAANFEAGANVYAVSCETAHTWALNSRGQLSPASSADLCLTLSAARVFVNSALGTVPPYSSRPVSLEPCANETSYRQRWRWSAPDERVTYNENSLRSEIPRDVQRAIRDIGTKIDPQATGAIYRGAQRSFSAADVTVSGEISYGPDERHVLTVYEGNNRNPAGGSAPVIVLVHGGGFAGGSLRNLEHVATHFAGLGFVAVNMTYPLAPEHIWPSGAESVAAAVNWVRANISRYRGDADQIYLMGHSAGGNHVANFVMRPSLSSPGRPAVAGAILASAALQADAEGPTEGYRAYFRTDTIPSQTVNLLDNIEDASVPVLITVAEFDPPAIQKAAATLYAQLTNDRDSRPRFRQIPGHGHISYISAIGTSDRIFIEEALDFILAGR